MIILLRKDARQYVRPDVGGEAYFTRPVEESLTEYKLTYIMLVAWNTSSFTTLEYREMTQSQNQELSSSDRKNDVSVATVNKRFSLSLFLHLAVVVYTGMVIATVWGWFIEPWISLSLPTITAIAIWAMVLFLCNQIVVTNSRGGQPSEEEYKKSSELSDKEKILMVGKKLSKNLTYSIAVSVSGVFYSTVVLAFCWVLKLVNS